MPTDKYAALDEAIVLGHAIEIHATPTCGDHDEDCSEIVDKAHCWLYAPERGMCPYLLAAAAIAGEG